MTLKVGIDEPLTCTNCGKSLSGSAYVAPHLCGGIEFLCEDCNKELESQLNQVISNLNSGGTM